MGNSKRKAALTTIRRSVMRRNQQIVNLKKIITATLIIFLATLGLIITPFISILHANVKYWGNVQSQADYLTQLESLESDPPEYDGKSISLGLYTKEYMTVLNHYFNERERLYTLLEKLDNEINTLKVSSNEWISIAYTINGYSSQLIWICIFYLFCLVSVIIFCIIWIRVCILRYIANSESLET